MRKVLKKNVGLTLVVTLITALCGAALVVRSVGATPIVVDKGYDTFTTPNNAQTFDDFSSHATDAGFFGPNSKPFVGRVTFKGGAPINPSQFGTADTVIEREQAVAVPGDTTLEVIGISFVSAAPITVEYYSGGSTTCNVAVSKSTVRRSGGSMHFNADGSFTSSLVIYPKYTFTCGNGTYTLDTGTTASHSINLSSTNGTWSQSGSVTVVNPGTEQDLLASHNVVPAPTPCPPTPVPTATVAPGPGTVMPGTIGNDTINNGANFSAHSSASSIAVATPCHVQATQEQAVDSQRHAAVDSQR